MSLIEDDMEDLIYLRPLKREDALISYKWRNDPNVWRYTGSHPDRVITPEIELAWIDKVLVDVTSQRYAICLCENDKYVGNVQLTNINGDSAVFHIFIGERSMWNKGIGSQATKKMIEIAKNKLNLKILKLWVNPDNIAAVKAYQKNGFSAIDTNGNMVIEL